MILHTVYAGKLISMKKRFEYEYVEQTFLTCFYEDFARILATPLEYNIAPLL